MATHMNTSYAVGAVAVISLVVVRDAPGQFEQRSAVKEQPAWQQEVLKVWAEQDSIAAFAKLEASGPPELVAQRYGALAQDLFNDRRDLPRMILAARAGIQFSLQRARELDATNEKDAAQFRGHAKTVAYNLGANCWPGWMEPGITITLTERVIGLDAARLNLRLAVELQRPSETLGHAHWLLGAQLLAADQFDAAAIHFAKAAQLFKESKKPAEEHMALSYEKLTRRLQQAGDPKNQEALKQSLATLELLDNDDARFFAEQIRTAEKAFAK
jgi:hypothetical protein